MLENNANIRVASDIHGVEMIHRLRVPDHLTRVPFTHDDSEQLKRLIDLDILGDPTSIVTPLTLEGMPATGQKVLCDPYLINKTHLDTTIRLPGKLARWIKRHKDQIINLDNYMVDPKFREGARILCREGIKISLVSNLLATNGKALMEKLALDEILGLLDHKIPMLLRTSKDVNQILAKLTGALVFRIIDGRYPIFMDNDFVLARHMASFFPIDIYTPTSEAEADRQMDHYKRRMRSMGHEIYDGLDKSQAGNIHFDSTCLTIAHRLFGPSQLIPGRATLRT